MRKPPPSQSPEACSGGGDGKGVGEGVKIVVFAVVLVVFVVFVLVVVEKAAEVVAVVIWVLDVDVVEVEERKTRGLLSDLSRCESVCVCEVSCGRCAAGVWNTYRLACVCGDRLDFSNVACDGCEGSSLFFVAC